MEKEQNELLQQLAEKMGTTTEYLWSVLLKQAPIDSTTTLIQIALVVLFGYVIYKLHLKFSKKKEDGYSNEYDNNPQIEILMFVSVCIFGILAIASFFCIQSVINGYVNPEYWALKQILDTINN